MQELAPDSLIPGADKIELSPDGLTINGTLAIRQIGPFYIPCLEQLPRDDERASKLSRIARDLNDGNIYNALIYASTTRWSHLYRSRAIYSKANFNIFEARDYRGWWTRLGSSPADTNPAIAEIGYNGFFHDVFVDQVLDDLRKAGAIAEKNITIVGLPGLTSIPDIIALPAGGKLPTVFEMKTGADPPFTPNQQYIYPLVCKGGHVNSLDKRLPSLGLAIGKPFPPLDVHVLFTSGPGQPVHAKDLCKYLGLRP